ncbi:MAG: T9SS type A sorting domain-containing protein [Flavobacteriales bacterium]|nr:T9SS type A sorting domain-containing protein [Flavobacteriales bacterium]MBK8531533.1 T9SS type A sorting domain-containing protein [Flavobacteriales bacterium]
MPYPSRNLPARHRWRVGLTAMACIGLMAVSAQTADQYVFSSSSGASLDPMIGATTLVGSNTDDGASGVTGIGFTFSYEETPYTDFSVNSNGGMRLGGAQISAYTFDNINDASNNPKLIAFMADGGTTPTGNVSTVLVGSTPNQIRIIQWNVGVDYNAAAPNCLFQVWLHEGSDVIDLRYGTGAPTTYPGGNAYWWTGISGATGSNFLNVRPGPVGSNSDVTRLAAWPGNDLVLTFTPPSANCITPSPGNTLAAAASICPGMSTALSVANPEAGPGITHQWESSPNGSTWTVIGGATDPTHNSGALASTTWFRCVVTCAIGPVSTASNSVQVVVSSPAPNYYAFTGIQYTEDFSTWQNLCSTNDVPDTYWTNSPAYGPGTWRSSTTNTGESGWSDVGGWNYPYTISPGLPMARFHSRQGGSVPGTLDFHIDMSAGSGGETMEFEYINYFGSGTLAVLISTDGGSTFTQTGSTLVNNTALETKSFTIGSTSAITVIRLNGTAGLNAGGNDIGVDNFRIVPVPACAAPTAPIATVTGPGSVDIGWICTSCTGTYLVEYGPLGFSLGTGTVAGPFSASPGSISGVANGNYQAYVRQDCGLDGLSLNSSPVNFSIVAGDFCANAIDLTTLSLGDWSIIGNTTGALNNYTSSSCIASLPGPDVVLYHDVEVGATISIGLWSSANRLIVAYGGSCPGTTSLVCTTGGYFPLGGNVQLVNDYETLIWTNTGCQTERLYFLGDGVSTGGDIYVFNYAYVPGGPLCNSVTGVNVTITGSSTADIQWDATCSGNVVVEYGATGFAPGTGATAGDGIASSVSGTSTSLAGLAVGQTYDVYVRQDCGGTFSANGSPTSFTIIPGENCAVAIDLANESAPMIASTATAANDNSTLDCGAAPGGDLVYFIAVPIGATIDFEALHDYNAIVRISYGASCPGTLVTCDANVEVYSWTNSTGSLQNVYWWQDGTDSGDFLLSWDLQDPCALDSDGDGVSDCLDQCPGGPEPGTPCNDGLANTIGDVFTSGCVCSGSPIVCTNELTLEFQTDGNPDQTTWEIREQGTDFLLHSGGPLNPQNGVETNFACLSDGCFYLRVLDSSGDGMTTGGYILRTTGSNLRIIDNANNFNGAFNGNESAISGGQGFCFPMDVVNQPIYSSCDKLDWVTNKFIVAAEDPAVTAAYATPALRTSSGYLFWFFDPNGSYSFRRFRKHSESDGYGTGALRANHFRINSWANTPSSPHLPDGVLLNVRIMGRVNWSWTTWGPACQFKMDAALAACPRVNLQDNPNLNEYSCGVNRVFGGSNDWTNRVTASQPQPVPGVSSSLVRYQFRFRIPGEAICIVRPPQTSPRLYMNWSADSGLQLECGKQYEVDVRVSLDGGANWCFDVASPSCVEPVTTWGNVCMVNITTSTYCLGELQGGSSSMATQNGDLTMYPNPNRGDQLYINLSAVDADVNTVSVDIYDLTGKRISARTIAVQDGFLNSVLDLNGEIASGLYMVNITAGDKTYTERLVIQK